MHIPTRFNMKWAENLILDVVLNLRSREDSYVLSNYKNKSTSTFLLQENKKNILKFLKAIVRCLKFKFSLNKLFLKNKYLSYTID